MHYLSLLIVLLSANFNQKMEKLNGRYNYLIEDENQYVQKDKITFKDSLFVFDNKYMPKGKVSYGNEILLENFINTNLIITISKDQIQKDTIEFYMHDKNDINYLDVSTGKGKLIKIK